MTRAKAEQIAQKRYIKLHGKDWVEQNAEHITAERKTRDDGKYEYRIICRMPPRTEYSKSGIPILIIGDWDRPEHKTVFLFDLELGTYGMIEHY